MRHTRLPSDPRSYLRGSDVGPILPDRAPPPRSRTRLTSLFYVLMHICLFYFNVLSFSLEIFVFRSPPLPPPYPQSAWIRSGDRCTGHQGKNIEMVWLSWLL